MTSHDVRDMLDLPGDGPRPAKKQKIAAPRPVLKGLAREVQNLSGDNPIAIVPEVTVFKKRRFGNRKPAAKWELRAFKNSARNEDSLTLRHWRRKADIPPAPLVEEGNGEQSAPLPVAEVEDSTFAKYNVRVQTPKYDDEQYNTKLRSEEWSRDETDYLMKLVQEYDLRWPVIWDRYEYEPPAPQMEVDAGEGAIVPVPKVRTLEDMKARYYFIAAAMMKVNKPPELMNAAEFNLLELMQHFNPAQEAARKKFAEAAFYRTKEEAREEESLLLELKRILARSEKLSEERRELYARLEAPLSHGNIGVYTSSQGLQQLLQQLMTADKTKKRRSLMGSDGVSPAGPSGLQQQGSFDRRDSTNRESISGPSGVNNNKKGPSQGISERRQLTAEEEKMYGVKHIDRITSSGPAFRHEKISKPITSKSSIQQQKIANVLTELRISQRLRMPTEEVGKQFEILLQNINALLDQRKLADKLTGEINVAKAVKAEREKKERAERGEPRPGDEDGEAEAEIGDGEIKVEDGVREKSAAPSIRAGSVHKRSASVLSGVSDKSTKRQKK
jgi:DNA methyltransferase 1-associated protein 1